MRMTQGLLAGLFLFFVSLPEMGTCTDLKGTDAGLATQVLQGRFEEVATP